jgi:hypothetical protein
MVEVVDWGAVHHAYGPASDAREELVHLISRDAEERRGAHDWLVSSLFHQGTVYPATVLAVPILATLVADRETPDRVGLATALGLMAGGRGMNGTRLARAEVGRMLPLLLGTWSAADPGLRKALAFVAGHFAEQREAIRHMLGEAARVPPLSNLIEPEHEACAGWTPCATCVNGWETLLEAVPDEVEPMPPAITRDDAEKRARDLGELPADPRRLMPVIRDCLDAGYADLARPLIARLGTTSNVHVARALEVEAAMALGETGLARQLARELALAWLQPPASAGDVNQQLVRADILAALARFDDADMRDLAARVKAAPDPSVWTSSGDSF